MTKTYKIKVRTRKSVALLRLIGCINDFDFILGSEQFSAGEVMFIDVYGKLNNDGYDAFLMFQCKPDDSDLIIVDKETGQQVNSYPGLPISDNKYSNIWYREIDFNEIMECLIEN